MNTRDAKCRSRLLAIIAASALTLTGLSAAPAVAAPAAASAPEAPLELALEGTIRVLPDETATGAPDTVTLFTESGAAIDLAGAELEGAITGSAFEGTVAVDGDVAEAVSATDTAAEAEAAVAETQTEPVQVTDAVIQPPRAASVAAAVHAVDVMWVAPSGYARPALTEINAMVSRLSDFWATQSNGQVASITGTVKYGTVAASGVCDYEAVWDYASGPSGFNRTGPAGGTPQSYYWTKNGGKHLLVVVPGSICGVGTGIGTVGSVHAGGIAWASVNDQPSLWDQVAFHEIGHNLGLGHSNVTSCALPAVEPTSACGEEEYQDHYDVMGGGITYPGVTNFHDLAALNVSHKVNLDALARTGSGQGLATVTVTGVSQTFTINANGLDTGLRGLEILNPKTGERTFVEYRRAVGRDANAFYKRIANTTSLYREGVRFTRLECTKPTGGCPGAASTVIRHSSGRLAYAQGDAYTALDASGGGLYRVDVISTAANTATVQVTPAKALASSTPTITGTAQVGATLTVNPGAWTTGAKLAYQWKVGGADASGATAKTFVPRAADVGKVVSVTVTGSLSGYATLSVASAATAPVALGALSAPTPLITGTPNVGALLTAVPGWTTGTTYAYQWRVDGAPVTGATAPTFVLDPSHLGAAISVTVTGTLTGYAGETKTSAQTASVGPPFLSAPTPAISGTVKLGIPLTAVPGTWTAGATLGYQWYVGGAAVSGATKQTFVPGVAHVGRSVTVKVTGTLAGYATTTTTSKATAAVAKGTMSPAKPKISGTKKVGKKLTAKPAAGAGLSYKYQWYANGKAIKKATGKTYKLKATQRGKKITVKVTYAKAGYVSVAKKSAATAKVR